MDEIEELAEIFKALSDPTRLRLVKLLGEHKGALCVNALARVLGVTQSAVSQHLRILRQVGLVNGQRRGYFVHYSLDRDRLEQYKARLRGTLGEDFVVIK
jgi:DNA-binding transcriptional ArsR family regulator